jgi:uncharacterized protein YegJ (DUF2314 family)
MRTSWILALGLLAAACGPAAPADERVVEREGQPDIVNYDAADRAMNKAVEDARSKLPYFLERFAAPAANESDFMLKVAFPVPAPGDGVEHMWVINPQKVAEGFSAELNNEPYYIKNLKVGQVVTFPEDQISDWGFSREGKLIGYYTTRVSLDDMEPAQAADMRALLGENPD